MNTSILKPLIAVFLSFFFNLSLAQQMGFDLPKGAKKARIPFEKYNNLVVIPITINGTMTLKFIVDTGVQHPILTEKALGDNMGFNYARKLSYQQDTPHPIHTYISTGVKLKLPGHVTSGDNQSIMVLETDYFNLRSTSAPDIYGMIGYDLFRRFIVEVDQINQELVLHEPASFETPKNYEKVPLEIIQGKPYINAGVTFENWEQLNTKLMLDMGASHAILFDDDSTSFYLPAHALDVPIGRNFNGEIKGVLGRVRQMQVEEFLFENPLASFATSEDLYVISENKLAGGGAIGGEVLNRFSYILDYHNNAVYFKKTTQFGKPFEFDMSGLTFQRSGKDYKDYEVIEVRDGSPANTAGLEPGDIVKSINGDILNEGNFGHYVSLLRSKPGKKVSMIVQRGSEEVNVSFKLLRLI